MKDKVLALADTPVFTILEDIVFKGSFKRSGRGQGLGWRKDQLIGMLPAESAGDLRLEADILSRIPPVEQGIFYQVLVKSEDKVA
jgi:hypothetical protein